ncbi:uncharacterized protein ABDE67_009113 [Symphorus nematophorus]
MQYRSKGKSCGYYMRIVFFFSSLIQSLIIVSLVLFLVYGKKQDSASTSRIQDLEESFSRLSIENVALRQQRKNLTTLLNSTLTEKARNDWDLAKLRYFCNISALLIQDIDKRLQQCTSELFFCKSTNRLPGQCPQILPANGCNCGLLVEQMNARLMLVESNFTQTTQRMRMEMDQIAKDRDNLNLEVIRLRRDKSTHEKEVEFYRQKCKDDFVESLSGVSNVTRAFLHKVDSLFPTHIAFQLTCPKQREHLEQIRTNCTSLSREVEDKFQQYLNSVGEQVSRIQSENSRLKAENWRLSEDYRWCSQNRTGLIKENKQNLDKLQRKHDEDKERLLMDKMRLNGQIEVLQNNVRYKMKEVDHLSEQLKHLNMSCMTAMGYGGLSRGLPSQPGTTQNGAGFFGGGSSSSGVSQLGRSGPGSTFSLSGSQFNKPASTGTGSSSTSLWSTGSSSSNKPASTGTGSSSTSLWSTGSSSSNKPASTGTGSSSTSLWSTGSSSSNKPASTGTGSSSTSLWSTGSSSSNKPASTGTGSSSTSLWSSGSSSSNKPASTGTGSSSTSLWSSGSSSSNKPASTGTGSSSTSLWSSGSSSSNKPASTGTGSSSTSLWSSGSSSSNKPASTGTGSSSTSLWSSGSSSSNKPASTGRGSSTSVSSPGSTGSTNKSGSSSSGLGWFGFGGSNSGQAKTGSGTGKGPSGGTGYGGPGSVGAGRTSGLGGGSVSVAQHLKDLQRLINPAGPEEKQDLSRMLG